MELINVIASDLTLAGRVITYIRRQNHTATVLHLHLLSTCLADLVSMLAQNEETLRQCGYELEVSRMASILGRVTEAQEAGDYILAADLLELLLVPFLLEIQGALLSGGALPAEGSFWQLNIDRLRERDAALAKMVAEHELSGNCVVEPASSGHWTLKMTDHTGCYYFHSNTNPETEGDVFAGQYYSAECGRYTVLGLGLGYHAKAMAELDEGICMDIVEADLDVIRLAHMYMDLSWLYDNPGIRLLYDERFTGLRELVGTGADLVVHYPSLRHIGIPEIKQKIEKFFLQDSGFRNVRILLMSNFRENILRCEGCVDELAPQFRGKNAVIVAAGPSLDRNVEELRNKPENTLIVAVGAVFRKLVGLGIRPDYVVFSDPMPGIYAQIEGMEDSNVPILCLSTTYRGIAASYAGKRYLVCQNGYPAAEAYAGERQYHLYETGGSVSTTTLDICLYLGCREIAFVGLDLAFTGSRAHADDAGEVYVDENRLVTSVPAIGGGMVPSNKVFAGFREWIERRAAREDAKDRIVDATEGGAVKKGLRQENLSDVFDRWRRKDSSF